MTLNVKGGEETGECHREYACTLRNLGSRYEEEKNGNGEMKREKKREREETRCRRCVFRIYRTTAVRRNGQNPGLKSRRLLPTRSNHPCFFLHLGLIGFLAKSRNIPNIP